MKDANCREWTAEVVECARAGSEPGTELRNHLLSCSRCSARWEDELRLTSDLLMLREAARLRRPMEARREQILREFDARRRLAVRPIWTWAMAAAAAVLLVFGVAELRAPQKTSIAGQASIVQESGDESGPADNNGFIEVPYAPPLAAGELVSVVRTELQPTALARMGIPVDLASANDIPADVMVGEDGLPRAVRLVGTMDF